MSGIFRISELEQYEKVNTESKCFDIYDIKREYFKELIKDYEVGYIRTIYNTLTKCYYKEKRENEDLCKFSQVQLEQLLYQIGCPTMASLDNVITHLSKYIDFCIQRKLVSINYNLLRESPVFSMQNREKFLNAYKFADRYFSKERLESEVMSRLVNPQDKAVIQLVYYEAVRGKGNCELTELKEEDVEWENNILNLRDENGQLNKQRRLTVSDTTMRILSAAYKQETYQSKNGSFRSDRNVPKTSMSLIKDENKYIFRNTSGGVAKRSKMDGRTLENRIRIFAEVLNISSINITKLLESGLINKGIEVMKENETDELTHEQLVDICNWSGKSLNYISKLKRNISKFLELKREHDDLSK